MWWCTMWMEAAKTPVRIRRVQEGLPCPVPFGWRNWPLACWLYCGLPTIVWRLLPSNFQWRGSWPSNRQSSFHWWRLSRVGTSLPRLRLTKTCCWLSSFDFQIANESIPSVTVFAVGSEHSVMTVFHKSLASLFFSLWWRWLLKKSVAKICSLLVSISSQLVVCPEDTQNELQLNYIFLYCHVIQVWFCWQNSKELFNKLSPKRRRQLKLQASFYNKIY